MNTKIAEIYAQFKKSELLEIVDELDIPVKGNENTRRLSELILKDLDTNGVPEDLNTVSDSLYELLVAAEYIDEDGNFLESVEEEEDTEVVKEVATEELETEDTEIVKEAATEELETEEIPDWICFSYADPRDPACNKCTLYVRCWKERLRRRPECFGSYSPTDPECKLCIESIYCIKETKNGS